MKEIEQQNERLKRKLVRIEGKQLVRLDTTLQVCAVTYLAIEMVHTNSLL